MFGNKSSVKINMGVLNNNLEQIDYTLSDLLDGALPKNLIDQKIIDKVYTNELSKLLQSNSVLEISKMIMNLEIKIDKLEKILTVDLERPSLTDFYLSLSPVFLQMIIEADGIDDVGEFRNHCLEAVRIAIEEELSIWQEKTNISAH